MNNNTELTKSVVEEVAAERQRQIDAEGWSPEHDDMHSIGDLAKAASVYADGASTDGNHKAALAIAGRGAMPSNWPWDPQSYKPKSKRRDLVRAAALIIAEIERLDRGIADAIKKNTATFVRLQEEIS